MRDLERSVVTAFEHMTTRGNVMLTINTPFGTCVLKEHEGPPRSAFMMSGPYPWYD